MATVEKLLAYTSALKLEVIGDYNSAIEGASMKFA